MRNGAEVNLLTIIDDQTPSVIELLKAKFAFSEIGYTIEQGVIAFYSPNPRVNLTSNEKAGMSRANSGKHDVIIIF